MNYKQKFFIVPNFLTRSQLAFPVASVQNSDHSFSKSFSKQNCFTYRVTIQEICTAYRSFSVKKVDMSFESKWPGIICKELTNLGKMFSLECKAAKSSVTAFVLNIFYFLNASLPFSFVRGEAKRYLFPPHPLSLTINLIPS